MAQQLKVKLIGSSDDINAFLDVLQRLFDGRVLTTKTMPNDREPGYHVFAHVRIADLQRFEVDPK